MPLFVELILPLPLKQTFTYQVPECLKQQCSIGKRAIVSFGRKKLYTGIIAEIHNRKPTQYKVKPIEDIIDKQPAVTPQLLSLWEWGADYYMCSQGDFYKASVPTALRLASETQFIAVPDCTLSEQCTDDEKLIYEYILHSNTSGLKELEKLIGINPIKPINKLIKQGAIIVQDEIKQRFKPKTVKFIKPNFANSEEEISKITNRLKRAKKQSELFAFFVSKVLNNNLLEIKKTDLSEQVNVSNTIINSLIEKGIFVEVLKEELRIKSSVVPTKICEPKQLNEHQSKALQEIENQFVSKNVVLLHGVTSSGKTEVYIHLIKKALQEQKQVLYLLPEIAITPQIIQRLQDVFGNSVGVYHSKLSNNERVEIWNNLLGNNSQSYKIMIGVRSSILLPFSNLGLVIVDEEHENTYKQFDPAPRYQARDLSVILAKIHNAKVLLGSATPSVESYYNAQTGLYGLVKLQHRHKQMQMPKILIADVLKAYKKKQMQGHFSPLLLQHIEEALNKGEQVILFQNRRGFSPYLICRNCSEIPTCKYCDVSLTYHKFSNQLVCHYCGYQVPNKGKCKQCGEHDIQTKGFGTEKIEEDISLMYPQARVGRLDLDTTRNKYGHEQIIEQFEKKQIDILIGTQMVAKGLDFNNVSLVGILNADNMLSYPDFRAYERSFQLMAQVSGRAGRSNKQGTVIIQTNQIDNEIIHKVANNDYEQMFSTQLSERKLFSYPPFVRILKITAKHKNADTVNKAINVLFNKMSKVNNIVVLNPVAPIINKIQNYYLQQIIVKLPRSKELPLAKQQIDKKCDELLGINEFKQIILIKDVDAF